MGDRGNIRMKYNEKESIYFYTHWNGSYLPEVVQTALKKKERWDDEPYLSRIVFCELVDGQEKTNTGFGIYTHICDNEHPIVVIDTQKQEVYFTEENKEEPVDNCRWSFKEFVETDLTILNKKFGLRG